MQEGCKLILPDVLQNNLSLVFCGTAASTRSAQVGAYYAGPGNRFWQTLHHVGLTPYQLEPQAFQQVVNYGIGLTDVAKQAFGADSSLQESDFDPDGLHRKIRRYAPGILAFTSKRAFRAAYGLKSHACVEYGWQVSVIGMTRLYVLPSPSGAARGYWDVTYWQALADAVKT